MTKKLDLYNNKYDLQTLKTNIYFVSLVDILKTQTLTAEFCVKYILNSDFQLSEEEDKLTIDDVKKWQPHILEIDLMNAKKLIRTNSFEDFESFANKTHL